MTLAKIRLTRAHQLIYGLLAVADKPLSAYEILAALKDQGITAPPTVYRALDKLMAVGLAHRLESLNAYVACGHAHARDHIAEAGFALCGDCGTVTEFSDGDVQAALARWAASAGFALDKATVELKGRCAACQEKQQ